jgi:hypothetical protein
LYHEFETAAKRIISTGRETYGARCILENVRYNRAIRENGPTDFKINNNTVGLLSRHFSVANPEHDGFFKERLMVGEPKDSWTSRQIFKQALGLPYEMPRGNA